MKTIIICVKNQGANHDGKVFILGAYNNNYIYCDGNDGINVCVYIMKKLLDLFYALCEHCGSKVSVWAWHKRWNKKKGTKRNG